jgi:hypothetical protein
MASMREPRDAYEFVGSSTYARACFTGCDGPGPFDMLRAWMKSLLRI